MAARLIDCLATTEALAKVFADGAVVEAMLAFESALARAEARVGVIPREAADAIGAAARGGGFDAAQLSRDALRAGTLAIPLVKALTDRVRATDAEAAGFVHWGATSQDVMDSALVLLLRRAQGLLRADAGRLEQALARLAEEHKDSVMLARTLLQPAPPVTFGLKAAGWLAAARRGWSRVDGRFTEAALLQFGGASGTLAALGENGPAVSRALAAELGISEPDAPWHGFRDRFAAMLAACSVYVGTLGKMARDVSLLMQSEVGEAAEGPGDGRGGSSTMPHKHNPVGCAIALAAAHRVPGLLAGFLSGMVQEHERGLGGWQAESPAVTGVIQSTGAALASMADVAEGLAVDPRRMRANLEATRGVVFAERVMMMLGERMGRDTAHRLLADATRAASASGRRLVEALAEIAEVTAVIPVDDLSELERPEGYLGSAEIFRKRLVGGDK